MHRKRDHARNVIVFGRSLICFRAPPFRLRVTKLWLHIILHTALSSSTVHLITISTPAWPRK